VLWKRTSKPTNPGLAGLSTEAYEQLASALVTLSIALVESTPALVISPGSQRSISFLQTALRCSSELKTGDPSKANVDRIRQVLSEHIPDFGKWQQQEVMMLIDGLTSSLRSLAGTLGEAADVQEHAVESLASIHHNLEKARRSTDIVEIKEVLLAEIESAKRLLDQQTALQRTMQTDYNASVQDLEDRLAKAEEASQTDHLTLLANRAAFDYYGEAVVQKAKHGEGIYSLAMVDLDEFKGINDGQGHVVGDLALNLFAGLLKQYMGQGCFIARFGGDEFTVVMSNTGAQLQRKLSNLSRVLARKTTKVVYEDATILIKLAFSAGITDITGNDTMSQAVSRADANLYAAKHAGKGGIVGDELKAA
jgi:diguanylate cyclase (GGDEF)-like protein